MLLHNRLKPQQLLRGVYPELLRPTQDRSKRSERARHDRAKLKCVTYFGHKALGIALPAQDIECGRANSFAGRPLKDFC
jgi:hypothetical protein